MARRREIYVFGALIVALIFAGYYFFSSHDNGAGLPGVLASDQKFEPLDVRDPELRMDLLEKIHKLEYQGSQRNIFVATPPPPPQKAAGPSGPQYLIRAPRIPPPPPPLQVPVEFFGVASESQSGGRRVAFFSSGDDVLVVAEGETFLGRFRLDRINNDTADVEEISSGRHATVQLVQPSADQNQGSN